MSSGATCKILVHCLTQEYGFFTLAVKFEFTGEQTGPFFIGRFVSAVCSSEFAEELGPTAPYQPYQAKLHRPQMVTIVDGIPPNKYVALIFILMLLLSRPVSPSPY